MTLILYHGEGGITMRIRRKVEELRQAIEEETGLNPTIEIYFHRIGNKINYYKANKVGRLLGKELNDEPIYRELDSELAVIRSSKNNDIQYNIFFSQGTAPISGVK